MMETLTASTVKAFFENQRDKDRSFLCPALKDCVFSRQEIRVSGFRNRVYRGFPLSVSVPVRKTVRCINPVLSSSQTTDTSTGDEEIRQIVDTTQTQTVHVKFQLKRECSFGEQFFMVGDDPMFGLWDPSNAVPLNWSEEHVWKVELDLPSDKEIKYKFILKGAVGVILWQPGPDRVFQTWGTSKTISVSVDWENAELQTIVEEEDTLLHTVKDSLEESPAMIVTENSPQLVGDLWDDDINKIPNSTNDDYMNPTEIRLFEKPTAIIAENITEQNGELGVDCHGFSREGIPTDANNFENNVASISGENLTLSNNEENLDSGIGFPALVPGLTSTAEVEEEEEEESIEELDKGIDSNASSLGSDKDEGFSVPELSLEEENAMLVNEKQELQGNGAVEEGPIEEDSQLVQQHCNDRTNKGMENDLQWGRRKLQQFLTTLGLLRQL